MGDQELPHERSPLLPRLQQEIKTQFSNLFFCTAITKIVSVVVFLVGMIVGMVLLYLRLKSFEGDLQKMHDLYQKSVLDQWGIEFMIGKSQTLLTTFELLESNFSQLAKQQEDLDGLVKSTTKLIQDYRGPSWVGGSFSHVDHVENIAIPRNTWGAFGTPIRSTIKESGTYLVISIGRLWCIGARDAYWKSRIVRRAQQEQELTVSFGSVHQYQPSGGCAGDGTSPAVWVGPLNENDLIEQQYMLLGDGTEPVNVNGDAAGQVSLYAIKLGLSQG